MRLNLFLTIAVLAAATPVWGARNPSYDTSTHPASSPAYVIANDDTVFAENSIGFFQVGGSSLTYQNSLTVGGYGGGGGNFGAARVSSVPDSNTQCLYVSDGGSGQIASVNVPTQLVAGIFSGSENDAGTSNGIGLALNSNYLFASFTDSNTIGTFQILPGCQLSFIGDTTVGGLNNGPIYAIAVHGDILIATYADGSIQSFTVVGGVPLSNNDLQNSTGFIADYNNLPAGIDISQDGRYAIFGDGAIQTVVEVSDISSGRLTPTRVYYLGWGPSAVSPRAVVPGNGSTTVRLNPDESLLFVSNNQSGNVTAAFFNAAGGDLLPGCTSATLKDYYAPWYYLGSMVTENTSASGGVLYVAEFGPQSSIGILNLNVSGNQCSLSETSGSPATDPVDGGGVLSIWAYPPRPF